MWSRVILPTTMDATETLSAPTFWLITIGVVVVCFLSGPFGTFEALPNGFRFIYWTLVAVITGSTAVWLHSLVRTQKWLAVYQFSLVSLVYGLIVVGLVILLSLSLLDPIQRYPGHLKIFTYSFPTATIIFFLSLFLNPSVGDVSQSQELKRPDLIRRLEKFPNSERVLALCAQDHYVEVTTEKGTELCLIRLADAIAEAVPEDGIQIHRSHWVAKSAIERLVKKGSVSQVELTDGRLLTVSQSRIAALEAYLA